MHMSFFVSYFVSIVYKLSYSYYLHDRLIHYLQISDGVVNVHDLTVFAPITSLEKARGATMFVLDLQVKYLMSED